MLPEETYKNIDKLSNIARGFMQAQILITANELNIFTIIGEEGKFLDEIITLCKTDKRATEILLNALTSMKLLEKKGNFYKNSSLTGEHLIAGKEFYLGDSIKHSSNIWARFSELLSVVRTGKPPGTGDEARRHSPKQTRDFILGMANIASFSVEELLSSVDLSKKKYILDLGGGPGIYAISMCRKYSGLKAAVFDLPQVIPITEEQILKAGMEDRVNTIKGDYLKDSIGKGYDAVLLSNIIHSLGEKDNLLLFRKVREALLPGGEFIVKDFFPADDRTGPEHSLVFAVNMLVSTEEGNTYTAEEVTEWLRKSGFSEIEIKKVTPYTSIAIAV